MSHRFRVASARTRGAPRALPSARSCWLLPLLFAPGCLYIGGLNHAPQIESVECDGKVCSEKTLSQRCGQVTLRAVASDPDDDPLSFRWTVMVDSVEPEAPGRYVLRQMVSTLCDGTARIPDLLRVGAEQKDSYEVLSQGPLLTLDKLPLRGSYQVKLEVSDPDGATRSWDHSIEAQNQPPVISDLTIERDERFVDDKVPDLGNRMPVHAHYRAWVRQVTDHEGDLRCGSAASATWELVAPAGVVPQYFELVPCKEKEPPGSWLRFRLPTSAAASSAATLKLRVRYDDGHGGKAEHELSTPIHPNRPPCIDAGSTLPKSGSALASKPVPVLHEEGLRFDASLVNDDVPQGLSYTWLVRDQGSASFSVVQGQGPIFVLPPWYRPAGHQLELRAIVREHELAAPPCDDELALCPLPTTYDPGKALGECYAWVTWRLSFI